MSAKLSIAIYKAESGNYDHWALLLEHDDLQTIFEVEGEHPSFVRRSGRAGAIDKDRRPKKQVYVTAIRSREVQEVHDVLSKVPIDNETMEWNCQDYVLESLEALVEAEVIDEEDEDYHDARNRVVENDYGAN